MLSTVREAVKNLSQVSEPRAGDNGQVSVAAEDLDLVLTEYKSKFEYGLDGNRPGARIQRVDLTRLPDLVTLEELAEKVELSIDRIRELTDSGYMPCWFVDGGEPLYKIGDVRKYILENLVYVQAPRKYPIILPVLVSRPISAEVPSSLLALKDLLLNVSGQTSGVYFLVAKGEVVYVGQSVCVVSRVSGHRGTEKIFEYALYLVLPASELCRVESAFIRLLRPKYNKQPIRESKDLGSEDKACVEELASRRGFVG